MAAASGARSNRYNASARTSEGRRDRLRGERVERTLVGPPELRARRQPVDAGNERHARHFRQLTNDVLERRRRFLDPAELVRHHRGVRAEDLAVEVLSVRFAHRRGPLETRNRFVEAALELCDRGDVSDQHALRTTLPEVPRQRQSLRAPRRGLLELAHAERNERQVVEDAGLVPRVLRRGAVARQRDEEIRARVGESLGIHRNRRAGDGGVGGLGVALAERLSAPSTCGAADSASLRAL